MNHPLQLGVAKTTHLSGKTVTSAMGRELPVRQSLKSGRYVSHNGHAQRVR